jgi:hypothetical protein
MRTLLTFVLLLVLAAVAAPVASAGSQRASAESIAARAGGVPTRAARAAVRAADRVRREMRREGADAAEVRGCWRAPGVIDCTGVVSGNDGIVKWRCVLQIRVRHQGERYRSKLTDAVCVAEAA